MAKQRPSKKDLDQQDFLIKVIVFIAVVLFIGVVAVNVQADQITHKFKSPSFNGVNTSSHYLTIENQEFNRKQTIKDELKSAIEEAERDKENSTVQRFIRNFESRVYAELSRQLIANLFGETPSDSGVISLEGNTIEYSTDGDFLTLRITEADGTVTVITIPIGSFTF
tara:strand:- start:746 stop:1249 length:504 start_codon:yes stop_codon:yes gene_type:complete